MIYCFMKISLYRWNRHGKIISKLIDLMRSDDLISIEISNEILVYSNISKQFRTTNFMLI